MNYKFLWTLCFIVFWKCCFSQKQTEVLNLVNNRYVSEQNIILGTSDFNLLQEVCFDLPGAKGAAYLIKLTISLLDSTTALEKKLFDVNVDTSLLHCYFSSSTCRPQCILVEDRIITFSGTIRIISWKNNIMDLEFDMKVTHLKTKKNIHL